jgi:hypothetical protein
MLASLEKLGRVTMTQTKTTVLLAPNRTAGWRRIRKVIKANLHPTKGNAVYANLRSQKTFQWGSKTGHAWKSSITIDYNIAKTARTAASFSLIGIAFKQGRGHPVRFRSKARARSKPSPGT